MKPLLIISLLFLSIHAQGAVALTGSYTQNFNSTLSSDWTLSNLGIVTVAPSGYATVTNGTGSNGMLNPNATTSNYFGAVGNTFTPLKTPGSYNTYGIGGSWLINTGAQGTGGAPENSTRTASIAFDVQTPHTKIDSLSFQLGVGDSIDTGEGVFSVLIDGVTVWQRDFSSGGGLETPAIGSAFQNVGVGPIAHIQNANLLSTGFYVETWNANPTDNTQRISQGWTLESAYTVNLTNIAHTGNTLNVQFVWRGFNSDYADEFLALDNFTITVPEPSRALLFGMAFAAFAFRRRR